MAVALQCVRKFLKNLTPWRDSNPGTSVLLADAITAMPRRQDKLPKIAYIQIAGA
jgi:hypothetical protein